MERNERNRPVESQESTVTAEHFGVATTRAKIESMKPLGKRPIELTAFIPDMHVPFHDINATKTMLNFLKDIRPDRVVIMGDMLDGIAISKFDKDPRITVDFQTELEEARAMLDRIREVSGSAPIDYLEGNHEARLLKYIIKNAPALRNIQSEGESEDALSLPRLLRLKERNIGWVPYEESLRLHGWNFEHGDRASQFAAYTARAMVDRRRISTGIGHTHRAGVYSFTGADKTYFGVEFGCLIDRDSPAAGYIKSPNWQQGVGVGEYHKKEALFQVTPLIMQDYKFMFRGKLYSPKGVK